MRKNKIDSKQKRPNSCRFMCQSCGIELVPESMVMLLLAVYGQYRALYEKSGGLVRHKEFKEWNRKVGPMDNEQISRIFGFLERCGFVSVSRDGEYLISGKGLEAEVTHAVNLKRNAAIQ